MTCTRLVSALNYVLGAYIIKLKVIWHLDKRPASEIMLRKQNIYSKAEEIYKHFSEAVGEQKS